MDKLPILLNDLSPATIPANFADIERRSNNAVKALQTVTEITTDEDDKKAEQLLVKVRKTFQYIEGVRKGITAPLDEIKQLLMEPEKRITNASGSGNEYERVKKLRDAYANKKYQEEQKRQATIEAQRRVETEKARLRGLFKANYTEGIAKANMDLNSKLSEVFKNTTLDTIDRLKARMAKGIKLSEQTYIDFFDATKVTSFLPFTDIKAIADAVKADLPFELANEEYLKVAQPTFESWQDRLPELEKALTEGEEQAKAMAEKTQREEQARAEKAIIEAQEAAKNAANAEVLQAEFKSQIELQTGAIETRGKIKKRAILEVDTQDFVAVTSELFFNVFIHPKFPGIIKKDKKGVAQFREDGTPIYVDWFESLLDFYANNCEEDIPGIKIIEEVVTTQRAQK